MEANELMIGDWVKIVKDAPIMSCECHQIDWVRTGELGLDNRKVVTYPYIEPIPLTAEILEKNGWLYQEYPDDEKFIWPVDNEIEMPFRLLVGMDGNRYWVTVGIGGLMCPINYIHELQHALRLCGIEKEIEL